MLRNSKVKDLLLTVLVSNQLILNQIPNKRVQDYGNIKNESFQKNAEPLLKIGFVYDKRNMEATLCG